jgi:DNA-binding FrmR family transcriptional regulator
MRVRRIAGQTRALESALEQESECASILQQIAAIRGAVNGLMGEVLEGHLRDYLGADAVSPKERAEDLEQVVVVLRSYLR